MNKFIKSIVFNCLRFYLFHFFTLALLCCCPSQVIFAQTKLELNKPVERELKGGETHFYIIALEANQFLYLVTDQRGIDVVVTLYAPDNKKIVEVDSPNGTQGIEPLSYVASSMGTYRVEVKSPEAAGSGGSYQIVLEELRLSNEQDLQRLNAEKLCADGVNLLLRETDESLKKSVENFQTALKVFQVLNLSRQQADAFASLGSALSDLSQYKEAIADFEQSTALYKTAGGDISRGGEANALEGLALAYLNTGDRARAKL